MEITCKKCKSRLKIINTGSPIVKCGNCGYPNPVVISPPKAGETNAPPAPATAKVAPPPSPFPPPNPNPRPFVGGGLPHTPGAAPKSEPGWLVVHDENAPEQTHSLRVGRQVIGRLNTTAPCDIMITTQDVYMSRNHCILEVKPGRTGGFDYLLSDRKMTNGAPELMSANGTYVNAFEKPLQPNDMVYLNDGDTIQIGQTKVVIKTIKTVANADDATRLVRDTDYTPTVIIKN
ncbi:FHA domain-containing protein [Runella slithyformis]|uniref:Forkhead-associated protein n=1 Tax=Runella slithyformis (strain ATCC 29530 / DSM 19594 / LMG 11500 / NCIMB 11436 / LSU 4) TaxID=761193 RepID=A0A7U3ZQH9_RUNSL|nr:FHA domain-containing protein [Runella slithyformis]AEI51507.1 Forkhead-associated protein [Runella slithyformis DSM 19594]